MRKFTLILLVMALLLPFYPAEGRRITSFEDKVEAALIRAGELRAEVLGSPGIELNSSEKVFIEVEGERIPAGITELSSFKEGRVEVFILLEDQPLVEKAVQMGVPLDSPVLENYKEVLLKKQQAFISTAAIQSLSLKYRYTYSWVLNGFYVEAPVKDLTNLRKLIGVKDIKFAEVCKLEDRFALEIIRAPQVWTNPGVKGEGTTIAIVDTGVDYNHPDLGGGFGAGFKVIGGYDFGDNDTDPMDLHSHGTHVAGIAAGKAASPIGINGVAPEAKIVGYKIVRGGEGSATSGAIAAAFEHMVTFRGPAGEKVTAANLSFGSAGGFYAERLSHEIAMDNAVLAGIFVAGSAGNNANSTSQFTTVSPSGQSTVYPPDIGLVGSPNTAGLVTMVAASNNTHQEVFTTFLVVGTTPERRMPYILGGESPDPVKRFGNQPLAVVPIPSFGNIAANYVNLDVIGKVALVSRGGLAGEDASFVNKIRVAQTQGAAMIIVYNDAARGDALLTMATAADLTIPRGFTGFSFGQWLIDNPASRTILFDGVPSPVIVPLTDPDRIATFSSWGLTPEMGPKPEITAPGSPVYSADLVTHAKTTYSHKSGTSMAAPYTAGIGALVKQSRPTFTPQMIKAALVNTATVLPHAGTTVPASPRLQGGGRVDIPKALATPTLLTGLKDEVFISLGDTDARASISFSLKLRNLSTTPLTFTPSTVVRRTLSSRAPTTYTGITASFVKDGTALTSITVGANTEYTFDVSFSIGAITVDNTFAEGFVTLTPTAGTTISLSIPYVFFVGDFQDTRYKNEVPRFVSNMVIDPPRDEYWSWFARTWLYWTPDAPSADSRLYQLGLDYTGKVLSRSAIAISPNNDGVQDNLWPIVSLMRGTKDLKIQIRGEGIVSPLNLFSESWVRKNRSDLLFRSGWATWWLWDKVNIPEGSYLLDFISEVPSDPSPGDPISRQTVTLPFNVDVTPPEVAITSVAREGANLTARWSASELTKAGQSGIWGYQAIFIPEEGTAVYSPFLAPGATSHTFTGVPDVEAQVRIVTWDNAGNSQISYGGSIRPLRLEVGWNLVGLSSRPADPAVRSVFPGMTVYGVDTVTRQLVPAITIEVGKAYWVYASTAVTLKPTETYRLEPTVTISIPPGSNYLENVYMATIPVTALSFRYGGVTYNFSEAVTNRLISPTVQVNVLGKGYVTTSNLVPRIGFILQTYVPLEVIFRRP